MMMEASTGELSHHVGGPASAPAASSSTDLSPLMSSAGIGLSVSPPSTSPASPASSTASHAAPLASPPSAAVGSSSGGEQPPALPNFKKKFRRSNLAPQAAAVAVAQDSGSLSAPVAVAAAAGDGGDYWTSLPLPPSATHLVEPTIPTMSLEPPLAAAGPRQDFPDAVEEPGQAEPGAAWLITQLLQQVS